MDGTRYAITDPSGSAPLSFTVSELSLTKSSFGVQLLAASASQWATVTGDWYNFGAALTHPKDRTIRFPCSGVTGAVQARQQSFEIARNFSDPKFFPTKDGTARHGFNYLFRKYLATLIRQIKIFESFLTSL